MLVTNEVIQGLRTIVDNFERAAIDPTINAELEPEDAQSVREMYLADADSYRNILSLVENGEYGEAIEMRYKLDTAPRNVILDNPDLVEFFT